MSPKKKNLSSHVILQTPEVLGRAYIHVETCFLSIHEALDSTISTTFTNT